jgi:predicted dehydrogenase
MIQFCLFGAGCIGAIANDASSLVGGNDGVKALVLADAAIESCQTGRVVRI